MNHSALVAVCLSILVAAPAAWAGPVEDFAEAREADERNDYATAVIRMRALSEAGYPPAQAAFGALYFTGRGVPQDFVEAYRWYTLAVSRAEPGRDRDMAAADRDLAAAKITPEQIAQVEEWVRSWKPK